MDVQRTLIEGVPHWLYVDGTALPVMAGGDGPHPPPLSQQHHQSLHRGLEGGGGGGGDSNIQVEPVPGVPGAVLVTIPGFEPQVLNASQFLAATQGQQGFAPPVFSGTAAGIRLQAEQDRLRQAQADAAELDRQRLIERSATRRQQLADQAEAKRQVAADAAAKIRQLISTVGSGVQAQIGEEGAFRRSLVGEVGAGARSELEQFTARRGQSIGAVLDTFRNLGELSSRPSDFVRLAFNAQGIQPPGETPTDTLIGRQQEFFENQTQAANLDPTSFGDLFSQARGDIGGFGPAPNFGESFRQARRRIGGFQFGGHPQAESRGGGRAAIVGENQRPELVFGATEVIPNLSPSEVRLLRLGGVGGAQFGTEEEENVFDFPQLRPDAGVQPLFSGGFRRSGQGGVGAVTRAPALNPLDFSAQSFQSLLPFEQQLAVGRFGETIVDPETGDIRRAGIDPQTAFELIRRSSLFGNAPGLSRFG